MRKCERRLTARTVSQTSGLVPLQAHAAGDADVEHHAVQAAEGLGGLVDQPIAVGGLADVGYDPDRAAALALDERHRLVGRVGAHVDDRHGGALARGEDGDRLTVAGRRVGVVVGEPSSADDEHAPALESPTAGRLAARLRRHGDLVGLVAAHARQ